ncbi:MAG: putative toxin-antitoxin system toxin component, PIN family [Thermoleophilia bacterium]|nr:putative toxin-antitoxin system toxin component, PIN family [Thermoleophilia bacterium]
MLDTNVLLSAVLFGGLPGELVEAVRSGRVRGVTSLYILREFQEVLARPRFGLSARLAEELAVEMAGMMELLGVEAATHRWVGDPKDDPVVETALQAGATVIVTGDRRLLAGVVPGVRILTAAEAVVRLGLV